MDTELHILIAEDEEGLARTMTVVLRSAGYLVTTAANGSLALEALLRALDSPTPVDMLITDIQMPAMTGMELIDEINRRGLEIPVLAVTGFGEKKLVIELMRKGCDEYIDKPFTSLELRARVEALARRRAQVKHAAELRRREREERNAELEREAERYRTRFDDLRTRINEAASEYRRLTTVAPSFQNLGVAIESRSLDDMGGDIVDIRAMPFGFGILLADVAGHDIGASYHTMLLKAFFDQHCVEGGSGENFFAIVNKALIKNRTERMVAAVMVRLRYDTMHVEVTAAAHLPPTFVRAGEAIEPIQPGGYLLGAFEDGEFETKSMPIHPHDRIVLYTDGMQQLGLTDARTGRTTRLGVTGLDMLIERHRDRSLKDMIHAVWTDALAYASNRTDDDLMLIGLEIPEAPHVRG